MTYVAVDDVSPVCDNTNTAWPAQAQTAFEAAVAIWETRIISSVPIRVTANWTSCLPPQTLGSAGPSWFCPISGVYYAAALRDALAGSDVCGGADPDIEADFSSAFTWYLGTDGNTPANQVDFVSVVLHELGHGLGFVGTFDYSTDGSGNGSYGLGPSSLPDRFDQFVENGAGTDLITFTNPSAALGSQLTSNDIFWSGANGISANCGTRPRLYAPSTWDGGSSISHLSEATYPAGNANSLMTPFIGNAESIHDPGPITLGIFKDEGWGTNGAGCAPGTPTLDSVVALDSTTLRVNWSFGSPAGTEVHIEHAAPGDPWVFLTGDGASPYDHMGLAPNSTHCYRLQAHDHVSGLLSAYSNWACVTTPAASAPGTPTLNSVVALDSTTLRVSWSFGSPAGTEVHIEHAAPGDPWVFLTGDAASPYDHTGLAPNSTHCYRLLAHDHVSGLVSAYSNWTCVTTPSGPSAPGTPTLTSVVALDSTTLRVNWSFGSPAGTEVHIEHAAPGDPWLFLTADGASPYDHMGLAPSSAHCYRLQAHDHVSGLLSGYSNWACVTTPAGPGAPGAPTITSVVPVNSTTLRVNWSYGSPAGTEVHIEHALPYQPWAFLDADTASPYDHTGLTSGSTHCYRALAHDHVSGLVSSYSNWTCVNLP